MTAVDIVCGTNRKGLLVICGRGELKTELKEIPSSIGIKQFFDRLFVTDMPCPPKDL